MTDTSDGQQSDGNSLSLSATERRALVRILREETAQALGFVLVQLAALEQLDDSQALRDALAELRETVRPELQRILDIATAVERAPE